MEKACENCYKFREFQKQMDGLGMCCIDSEENWKAVNAGHCCAEHEFVEGLSTNLELYEESVFMSKIHNNFIKGLIEKMSHINCMPSFQNNEPVEDNEGAKPGCNQ